MTTVKDEIDGAAWLSSNWNKLLESYGADGKGAPRVRRLEVTIGNISAQLNGSKTKSYKLDITVPILDDQIWKHIIDILSNQAFYAAQMLGGSLPADIQNVFIDSGSTLLPDSLEVWSQASKITVEERKGGKKEKQAALVERAATEEERIQSLGAVYIMLGQIFKEEPWMLLELYGRTRAQILQALRERRGNAESTPPSANEFNGADDSQQGCEYVSAFYSRRSEREDKKPRSINEPGLEDQIDTFWGAPKRLSNIHHRIEQPEIELVLMRRLGPPPFSEDSIQIYEQFMALYRKVGDKAISLAYTADQTINSQ